MMGSCEKCGQNPGTEFCAQIEMYLCEDCITIFEAEGEEGLNEALGL